MKAKLNLVIFLTVLINQDFLYANEKANKSITTTISTEFLFDGDSKSDEDHDNRSELGSSADFYELGPTINSSDRIKGGVIAEHKWPFHVMLTKYVGGGYGYSCGGALIGLDQVVTAAHCVYNKPSEGHNKTIIDPANFIVKAGEYTMSAKDEGGTSQSRDLYAIRYDGHYTDISKGHDIVILSLSGPFRPTESVKKIGVCTREQQNDSSLLDWMVGIGIQGYYQNDDVIMGEQLKRLEVTVMDDVHHCLNKKERENIPAESIICAKGPSGEESPCKGDSGSGLYKVDPDSKLPLCVYGVVSMGPGCDGWSDYNVFTRISYYMPELINTMYSSEVHERNVRTGGKSSTTEPRCEVATVLLLVIAIVYYSTI